MVKEKITPRQGDIVWINLNPTLGHEQSGRRPALVISPYGYNSRTGMAIVCPITVRVKGYPFEVVINNDIVKGAVLVDQLRAVDLQARKAESFSIVNGEVLEDVLAKVRSLFEYEN